MSEPTPVFSALSEVLALEQDRIARETETRRAERARLAEEERAARERERLERSHAQRVLDLTERLDTEARLRLEAERESSERVAAMRAELERLESARLELTRREPAKPSSNALLALLAGGVVLASGGLAVLGPRWFGPTAISTSTLAPTARPALAPAPLVSPAARPVEVLPPEAPTPAAPVHTRPPRPTSRPRPRPQAAPAQGTVMGWLDSSDGESGNDPLDGLEEPRRRRP